MFGRWTQEADMRVQDVMTTRVHTVSPDVTADDAWRMMRTHRIHHLVVTQTGRIVGILSGEDVGGAHGAPARRNLTVGDLMTRAVVTVSAETTVRKAANLMRGRLIGCLVVVGKGQVVGIITAADLLELIGRGVDRPVASTTRWTLKHRAPHRKRTRAAGVW
jgi:acetoin utilization protein AcuB